MIKVIESTNQIKPSLKCHCLENSLNHKVKNTGETEVITIIIFKSLLSINTSPPQSYLILFVCYPIPFRLTAHLFFLKTSLFVWLQPD